MTLANALAIPPPLNMSEHLVLLAVIIFVLVAIKQAFFEIEMDGYLEAASSQAVSSVQNFFMFFSIAIIGLGLVLVVHSVSAYEQNYRAQRRW